MFLIGKKMCNYSLNTKDIVTVRKVVPIKYKDLTRYMNEYRDYGNSNYRGDPKQTKALINSRLIGLFLTILLVTVQRNKTIRKLRFDQVREVEGGYQIHTVEGKTQKPRECNINKALYTSIMQVKESRI